MENRRRSITCSTSSNVTSPFIFLQFICNQCKDCSSRKNLSNAGKVASSSFDTAKLLVALANSMKLIDVLLPS